MGYIYQNTFANGVSGEICIFECKTQQNGVGLAIEKRRLKLKYLKMPENDEDVIKYRGNGGIRTIGGGLTAETIGPLNFYYLTSGSSGTWSALSPIYLLNYPALFPLSGIQFPLPGNVQDALEADGGCRLLCNTGLVGGTIKYITTCAYGFRDNSGSVVGTQNWDLRLVKFPAPVTQPDGVELWTSPNSVIISQNSLQPIFHQQEFAVTGATFNANERISIQVVNGNWSTNSGVQKAFLTVKLYIEYD